MLLDESFVWTRNAEIAYREIKNILISPQVLIPYDPSLPLLLAIDASKTGLGAVLSHRLSNREERPIAYASRTMSSTEQRYPQIDKEALAIVCRMANYADYLAHFNYNVMFKPTKLNANADYCFRTPLSTTEEMHCVTARKEKERIHDEFDEFIFCQLRQLPVRAEYIARETRKDPHLGKIVQLLETGQNLIHLNYKAPEVNYTLAANCLMFEHRIVVPASLRQPILDDLHAAHAHAPQKFRNHHWEYPKGPWERVHIDYAGPVAGMMLLVIVDAYSKWIEVKITNSTTTSSTIAILDKLFAAHGVPVIIVSDNGPQFTAAEFKTFLQTTGVKFHKLTAPYYPATNGQAERYVQTVKDALNAMSTTRSSLQRNVNEFLRQYRKAPHSTTGQPASLLFLGRNIRTRIDLVRPDVMQSKIREKQQVKFNASFRNFDPEQAAYFLSGNPHMEKWIAGRIVTRLGDLHYEIDQQGKRVKRHIDQIRTHLENTGVLESDNAERDEKEALIYDSSVNPKSVRDICSINSNATEKTSNTKGNS
ncbi:PREDICTED: uncharacterized protein K02A2.6-like [Vollenhovia emeryi]|uniref:uncharacterized protein K02A2.6-like n=1 Tax=Vollenhovia emeryi TaxID=411798 RepID=UPI0005F44B92|nr:PREDICTED: uncharacterized protein K02A2.6-like [Vollenhovia emeryi]